jgi:hypothetical protein
MLRVLDRVDDTMPTVYETLFKPCEEWAERQPRNAQGLQPTVAPPLHLADAFPTLRDLYMAGELEWSEGEPAINVYSANGRFGAHKDHLALTVLIPLTSTATFTGGGTGFWAGGRSVDEDPWKPPDEVLKPPLGTALVFGGDVTHAGMPVEAGLRSVFVASFSTRTEASAEDRVQGLQSPPPVSAAFSGSDEADEDNVGLPPPPHNRRRTCCYHFRAFRRSRVKSLCRPRLRALLLRRRRLPRQPQLVCFQRRSGCASSTS